MDATTTAIFANVGISASSITGLMSTLFGQALSFTIYVMGVIWPYLLVIGLVYTVIKLVYKALGMSHR